MSDNEAIEYLNRLAEKPTTHDFNRGESVAECRLMSLKDEIGARQAYDSSTYRLSQSAPPQHRERFQRQLRQDSAETRRLLFLLIDHGWSNDEL